MALKPAYQNLGLLRVGSVLYSGKSLDTAYVVTQTRPSGFPGFLRAYTVRKIKDYGKFRESDYDAFVDDHGLVTHAKRLPDDPFLLWTPLCPKETMP